MPVVDFSAYDRAVGNVATEQSVDTVGYQDTLDPHVEYWSLVAIPIAIIALTGIVAVVGKELLIRFGITLMLVSCAGLALVTVFWLEQRLGLQAPSRAPPNLPIVIRNQLGGWLSISGHTLGLISGLLTLWLGFFRKCDAVETH